MNKEFDYLEKEFEKGWSKFIKEKRKENLAKNERVFKVLINLKGDLFANQLKQMMAHIGCTYSILHIVREPIGFEMNERRFSEISLISTSTFYERKQEKLRRELRNLKNLPAGRLSKQVADDHATNRERQFAS